MNALRILTSNYIINIGATSWILAQIIKTLITLLFTRKLQVERLWGAGGMPSSHSALTCSVAIGMARMQGFASPEFALALMFAMIVIYDAMGVRRAAGEHAKVLNRLAFDIEIPWIKPKPKAESKQPENLREEQDTLHPDESSPLLQKHLKEYLGHTPFEVLGGCLLGILVALFMPETW